MVWLLPEFGWSPEGVFHEEGVSGENILKVTLKCQCLSQKNTWGLFSRAVTVSVMLWTLLHRIAYSVPPDICKHNSAFSMVDLTSWPRQKPRRTTNSDIDILLGFMCCQWGQELHFSLSKPRMNFVNFKTTGILRIGKCPFNCCSAFFPSSTSVYLTKPMDFFFLSL